MLHKSRGVSQIRYLYYLVKVTENIANLLIGSFFIIFIYRITGRVDQTIIGLAIYFLGIAAGFHLIAQIGYRFTVYQIIRIAFSILSLTYFASFLLFDQLMIFIFPFVFMIGLGWGIFFLGHHLFQLDEFSIEERQPVLFTIIALTKMMGAIVPVLSGFIIETQGFKSVLVITAIIFLAASLKKANTKILKPDRYNATDLSKLSLLPGFKSYTTWEAFATYVDTLRTLSFILIPFFLLGSSELNLGILTSAVAFSAGAAGLALRRISKKKSEKYAFWASGLYGILNTIMAIAWNPLALTIRSLLFPIGDILYNPRIASYEYNNMEALLGNHMLDEGIEFQVFRETILLLSRLLAIGTFLIILGPDGNYSSVSRVVFTVFVFWPFAALAIRRYLNRELAN